MNSIRKAEADKSRQLFISQVEKNITHFCHLAQLHHPSKPSCHPFHPLNHDHYIRYGSFNLCVFVEFDAASADKTCERWVVRVPLPGRNSYLYERMSSELATMRYVSAKTTIPIPNIHAYSLGSDNLINSPFIIMDYVEGKTLSELEFQKGLRTPDHQVQKVYQEIAHVYTQLSRLQFPKIGALALGFTQEPNQPFAECCPNKITVLSRPLTIHMAMQESEGYSPDSIISPGETYTSARDFVEALVRLGENELDKSPDTGLDVRGGRSMLYARSIFPRLAHGYLSKTKKKTASSRDGGPFMLMHGDLTLHNNNLLFDDEFNLVSVIDWEWSCVVPMSCVVPPVWLTGSGLLFMVSASEWHNEETRKLLDAMRSCDSKPSLSSSPSPPPSWHSRILARIRRQPPQVTLSTLWATTTTEHTAAIAGLLNPDYIYEVFWCLLFYTSQGLVGGPPPPEGMARYSREKILPLLDAFMAGEGNRELLERKRREQVAFWEREREYFGGEEMPMLYDQERQTI